MRLMRLPPLKNGVDNYHAELSDRLRFETVLADQLAQFVNISPDQIDGAIQDVQRCIVEALDLDRSTIFQSAPQTGEMTVTHSWAHSPHSMLPTTISASKKCPWGLKRILDGKTVCFSRVEDLPPEAACDIATYREIGPKSLVAIPLIVGGTIVGCVAFGSLRMEREWPDQIVNRLRLVAQVFASALARKQGDAELKSALATVQALKDQLHHENLYLRDQVKLQKSYGQIVGKSQAILATLKKVEQVASTDATVLLSGETGTGKELIALAIHELGRRRERLMVRVNCAAIPTALIESELFGRERGAYTGALGKQIGRFELANGSTLFLDEIGDLPLEAQAKLLRALQEKEIQRLGSPKTIKVDVRVIAASNLDLAKAVSEGRFREDLYYRLNVFPITVPSLRDRLEDIPLLANAFIEELSKTIGKSFDSISKKSLQALQQHRWPGNIRELRNEIERAMILATSSTLTIELSGGVPKQDLPLSKVDSEHIRRVLDSTRWRIRGTGGAAEILGLKPTTLESRMNKLGLRRSIS
jgi:transcriptional regulator with GAF, ATPase, and Fis domain